MQALSNISCLLLSPHSNETRAPIANPPNSAQLEGTPTIPPTYIWVRAVVWECREGQTDTQTAVTTIHFASATPHANCNEKSRFVYSAALTQCANEQYAVTTMRMIRVYRRHDCTKTTVCS